MTAPCRIQDDGAIELYFYGELDETAHASIRAHLAGCRDCAEALEELHVIRAALSSRPDVASPASGEWTAFMDRLDAAVQEHRVVPFAPPAAAANSVMLTRRPLMALLAMAALLAVVAISVFMASRAGRTLITNQPEATLLQQVAARDAPVEPEMQAALTAVGLRHLERSKLVVLGLATKEPMAGTPRGQAPDWTYERELASSLLNDTRLYRQAAEQRGLTRLASVMRDLELVLLQTSMADAGDRAALPQIQRLIQKRGLVEKMDVVGTTGILP